VKHSKDHGVSS